MQYSPVGHITGMHTANIDVTTRLPWLYTIASLGSQVIYIGETYAEGGLIARLSQHFGPFPTSTLKQRAEEVASVRSLRYPFVIVAARLPIGDDAPFDAESKQVRLICEAAYHQEVALQFIPKNPEWTIVSTPQGTKSSTTGDMQVACNSIMECFMSAHSFLEPLSTATPFQLVILNQREAKSIPTEEDLGRLIEEIEMTLHQWMLDRLKTEYNDKWWNEGIPQTCRVQCASRREEEADGENFPREAYLTLIDLRSIAQKNWSLFQVAFEQISGVSGKERGTHWLFDLNEMRKMWAHPIKKIYVPIEPAKIVAVRTLALKVKQAITK